MKLKIAIISLCIQHILNSNSFNSYQKLELIQAKNTDGCSGSYISSQNGHDTVAKEYISLILASNEFNPEQKLELIQAKDQDGFPGLYLALHSGHDVAVKEYISIILNSNKLDFEYKKILLTKTTAIKWTGYNDLVYASNLTDEEKNILLKSSSRCIIL